MTNFPTAVPDGTEHLRTRPEGGAGVSAVGTTGGNAGTAPTAPAAPALRALSRVYAVEIRAHLVPVERVSRRWTATCRCARFVRSGDCIHAVVGRALCAARAAHSAAAVRRRAAGGDPRIVPTIFRDAS